MVFFILVLRILDSVISRPWVPSPKRKRDMCVSLRYMSSGGWTLCSLEYASLWWPTMSDAYTGIPGINISVPIWVDAGLSHTAELYDMIPLVDHGSSLEWLHIPRREFIWSGLSVMGVAVAMMTFTLTHSFNSRMMDP